MDDQQALREARRIRKQEKRQAGQKKRRRQLLMILCYQLALLLVTLPLLLWFLAWHPQYTADTTLPVTARITDVTDYRISGGRYGGGSGYRVVITLENGSTYEFGGGALTASGGYDQFRSDVLGELAQIRYSEARPSVIVCLSVNGTDYLTYAFINRINHPLNVMVSVLYALILLFFEAFIFVNIYVKMLPRLPRKKKNKKKLKQ